MKIKTAQGATYDTDKPAKSNICTVIDPKNPNKVIMDVLKLTGKQTIVEQFGEKVSMVEVETSFDTVEVDENFLWQ